MKILFLEKRLRTDKLGILYLSRVLKDAGHSVDLAILEYEKPKFESYDFIMYSVMTSDSPWYFNINKELKEKYNFKSVFGGPHFTYYPEQGIDDEDIDFIVRGPGEEVIVDIVEGKIKDKVTNGIIPDLSKMPHPDRTILYKYDYFGKANIKRFMACRDCYHSCKFCASKRYREIFKDQKCAFYQITDVDFILEEIEQVRDKYPPLGMVYFNDDDLAGHKEWFKEFLEKYKERINIPFGCEIRASSVNYDIIKRMAEANCHTIFIGLESSNKNTLKIIGRTVTSKQVENVCNWCAEFDIKVSLENMIGLPVDNPLEDAMETLEFNKKVPQLHSWCAIYQPFPDTELWQYCIDKGFLKKQKYAKFYRFEDITPLEIKDKEKISRLQKWWYYIVKHNIPNDFVKILLDISLSDGVSEKMASYRLSKAAKELYRI